MSEQQSSYRQIVKATSLFGGVQVFNIIISIIRSKFVAVLLGPAGMGVMGLLTSSVGLVGSLTNFGLGTSAVKDIAAAHGTGNDQRIAIVVKVFRKLVWFTGILGTLAALILSPWLSQISFGNREYTIAFVWISITLLFAQLSSGQLVILQGMRKLKYLAQANLIGSALGLIVTFPFYYFMGMDGIVPGIIVSSGITLLLSWFFSRKVSVPSIYVSRDQTITESKSMLQMGLMLSLSGLLTVGAAYVVRIFISRTGNIEQVGLYNAGFAIINTYVGLIFAAMGTDYYPRLSSVAHNNKLCQKAINQQSEIAILILAPILIIFIVFINWVIILLYTKQFLAVNEMIHWAALGMFFKAASWSIAFIFLAKGASNLFFWNELTCNIYELALNIIGYHLWGLKGLGLSFAIGFLFYLIQVFIISKLKFDFSFDRTFIIIFAVQISLAAIGLVIIKLIPQPYSYLVGAVLIIISGWYSIKELDIRLGLINQIKNYRHK